MKNEKDEREEIIFIAKEKLIPKNSNIRDVFNKNNEDENTSIAIMREFECLIMENVTKLIEQNEYINIKSVFISHLIIIFT